MDPPSDIEILGCKYGTDLQVQRTNEWLPEGRGMEVEGKIGEGD